MRQTLQCHVSVFVTCYFHAAVQTLCGLLLGVDVFKLLPIMWLHLMIWKLDEVKKVYKCTYSCTISLFSDYAVVIAWLPCVSGYMCIVAGTYCGHFTVQSASPGTNSMYQCTLLLCSMWPPLSRHI